MPLSIAQCRAARALLGWSIADLAKAAGVGVMTVNRFEAGSPVRASSTNLIEAAFAAAGLAFIAAGEASSRGGEGVRFSGPTPP